MVLPCSCGDRGERKDQKLPLFPFIWSYLQGLPLSPSFRPVSTSVLESKGFLWLWSTQPEAGLVWRLEWMLTALLCVADASGLPGIFRGQSLSEPAWLLSTSLTKKWNFVLVKLRVTVTIVTTLKYSYCSFAGVNFCFSTKLSETFMEWFLFFKAR